MNRDLIEKRSTALAKVRHFFEERNVLEIDCLALCAYPAIDAYIDPMPVDISSTQKGYLHTSPEYAMKRLLSEGSGDIYFLGHVFRQEELGHLHHPEFTMIEWYRLGYTFEQIIEETLELLCAFLGSLPVDIISYEEAFEKHLQISASLSTLDELKELAREKGLPLHLEDKDDYLSLLLSHEIEPKFKKNHFTVLQYYPPSQAALAKVINRQGIAVAERFEIYYQGVELANGYHELTSFQEQEKRFVEENVKRKLLGKEALSIDIDFLQALKKGLPDCSGVSVGFDRLLSLQLKKKNIGDVLSYCLSRGI